MELNTRLEHYLAQVARQEGVHEDLASVLLVIASTGAQVAKIISRGGHSTEEPFTAIPDEDAMQSLQQLSARIFIEALKSMPLSFVASEKGDELIEINPQQKLAVAIDPLDGSSNIGINAAIGTVFSILMTDTLGLYEKKLGEIQKAAGFLFYGPQTRLVLTCGEGTHVFLLNPDDDKFYLAASSVSIPAGRHEFAINTSNYRFWDDNVRYFIDDCVAGEIGPLGEDFNMRWYASLVAEAYRILIRGGVFLYPGDSRPGYESGRLQLLFDALPLAFIVEQAGGRASDGYERILDMKLASLQMRVPLIFGSSDRVQEVIDYMTGDAVENTRFPLFENRSLLRN